MHFYIALGEINIYKIYFYSIFKTSTYSEGYISENSTKYIIKENFLHPDTFVRLPNNAQCEKHKSFSLEFTVYLFLKAFFLFQVYIFFEITKIYIRARRINIYIAL